jgi:carbon-monoxide dehydrogenase small subunit
MRILRFRVNGDEVAVGVRDSETLLEVLRNRLGLTGTKQGCDLGDCGACTVLLGGEPVLACLLLAGDAEGREVTTIEGLASGSDLHPVQRAFHEAGAIQCGFCTPGAVLAAKALLDRNASPTRSEIRFALSGNLCRCTGYQKIVDAVELASQRLRPEGSEP